MFFAKGRAISVAELYQNLTHVESGPVVAPQVPVRDTSAGAFATYASAARNEHLREQQTLVNFILNSGAERSPVGSVFSTELIELMAKDRR